MFEVDLPKLLLGGAKIGWELPSDAGKSGVLGGVRSLYITQNSSSYNKSRDNL